LTLPSSYVPFPLSSIFHLLLDHLESVFHLSVVVY
jgi:hypothetical protein